MTKAEAKKRIQLLEDQIEELRYRYHVLNDPGVTDDVKDSLEKELKELQAQFPDLIDTNSSLNRIAGKPLDKFVKVKHEIRMLSLNDVFDVDELRAWEIRIKKLLPEEKRSAIKFFCEVKLDGLAASLVYRDGILVQGATRGDGFIGEDITQNLRTIESVPLKLRSKDIPTLVEIRGEAIMTKKVWQTLNREQERLNKPLFANTRNAAAGSLRQLDATLAASRQLDFFAYDIVRLEGGHWQTKPEKYHSGEHALLKEFGFKQDIHQAVCGSIDDVINFINDFETRRAALNYGTDGIVVSVDDLQLHEVLGVVGKAPRYMVAYKYAAEKATTQVLDISVRVGRTGVLTPVAHFKPTLVAGSMVAKATLHNIEQIERLGLKIGDTVVIQKAGDVIPEVVEVLPKLRTGKEKKFHMPKQCPACGGAVEPRGLVPFPGLGRVGERSNASKTPEVNKSSKARSATVAYFCTNPKCPAKNSRGMQHFVSIFEIYEIGPKILDRFQEEGLISDAADLFTLKKEDVVGMDRFGEKSAENIVQSIYDHKKQPLAKFLYALGIIHVGEQTAEDLAQQFHTLDVLMHVTEEEINAVENIGPVVSKSVHEYFHTKENLKYVQKLLRNGVTIEPYNLQPTTYNLPLAGKTFVITGTLGTMSRDEAKKKIKSLGGKTAESVSKNTDYVVVGVEPGSKAKKAELLGIDTLDEKAFLNIL